MQVNQADTFVASLMRDALVWDMTIPYESTGVRPEFKASVLPRIKQAGYTCASLSLIGDHEDLAQAIKLVAAERDFLRRHSAEYVLVDKTADVLRAKESRKLAVILQFQGSEALDGRPEMVEVFHRLGVRLMLIAYNRRNRAGSGCMDEVDEGLTAFGRDMVAEMERVGMLVDVAHTGYRTSREVLDKAQKPVIASHANPLALSENPRNLPDDILRAIAESGGVIGVTGIGRFLTPDNDSSTPQIVRHIDYLVDLLGIDHVGLGLDWLPDLDAVLELFRSRPDVWPATYHEDPDDQAVPEQVQEIAEALLQRGYAERDVRAVLGENWLRVCSSVWG